MRPRRCSPTLSRGDSMAAAVVALVVLLAPIPARGAVSISVSPIRVDLSVAPGENRTEVITVENRFDRPLRLRASIADWHLAEDGTPVFVKRGKEPAFSMSDWVEVNPAEFELPALGSMQLRYTVSAPPGTAAGGYRSAILIESLPEMLTDPRAAAAYLNARIGVILYNRIGTAPPEIEVAAQDFVPDPDAPDRLALRVTLRNTGRVHVRVSGAAHLVAADGRERELGPITDSVVLPKSQRYVLVHLAALPPGGEFTVITRLDVGLPELLEAQTRIVPSTRR